MRILILTQQWFPDALGGAYRVARDEAVGLARVGHEVTVCALGVSGAPSGRSVVDGVTVYRYGKRIAALFGMTIATLWRLPVCIRMLERTAPFDRIIVHDPYSATAVQNAGMSAPMLYVFHASVAQEAAIEGLTRWRRGWKQRVAPILVRRFIKKTHRLERAALDAASAVVVFSEYAERVFDETHPGVQTPGYIVPIGVDTDFFRPDIEHRDIIRDAFGLAPDRFYFVTVRRLTPRMGVGVLLEAMQMVHARVPYARLLIAGDGPLRHALEREVLERELDGVVQFLGVVQGEDLAYLYRAADCFVLPTQAFETFGLGTAEALASGLPAIGTPVGATPELLHRVDSSLLTADASAQALARTMLATMERTDDDRERLGAMGRRVVREYFGSDAAIKALQKLLASL